MNAGVQFKGLAGLAAFWCTRPEFQGWLGVESNQAATNRIYEVCNITSRAELDRDPAAAKVFNEKIREPYMRKLKERDA